MSFGYVKLLSYIIFITLLVFLLSILDSKLTSYYTTKWNTDCTFSKSEIVKYLFDFQKSITNTSDFSLL